MFISLSLLIFNVGTSRLRALAKAYVLLALILVFFAHDSRSLYGGVIGGLAFIAGTAFFFGRRVRINAPIRLVAAFFILLVVMGGTLLVLAPRWPASITSVVLEDMRLRRAYSLIDPTLGGTLVVGTEGTNRDDRLLGLTYGLELGWRNSGLGLGYGDNDYVDLESDSIAILIARNRLEGQSGNTVENMLFTHNSYGWAFGRLGFWLASAYFFAIGLLWRRGWHAAVRTDSEPLRVILLGTLAFVVHMLLLGFGGGAFFDYTGQGLITWLVCLAVLVRATQLALESPFTARRPTRR
jgi:hypothetical protein